MQSSVDDNDDDDSSSRLYPGDRLIEIDGVNVESSSRDDIVARIKSAGSQVTLLVHSLNTKNVQEIASSNRWLRLYVFLRFGAKRTVAIGLSLFDLLIGLLSFRCLCCFTFGDVFTTSFFISSLSFLNSFAWTENWRTTSIYAGWVNKRLENIVAAIWNKTKQWNWLLTSILGN